MGSQSVEIKLLSPEPGNETNNHVPNNSNSCIVDGTDSSKVSRTHAEDKEDLAEKTAITPSDNNWVDNGLNELRQSASHALSSIYAQIVVVIAAILVFTELLHGPIPVLFFHGYLFTYLVGGSIICFIGIYVSMLADRRANYSTEEKSVIKASFMKHLFTSDISLYLRIGAVAFGLGTLISCSLEIASIFTMTRNCMDELNLAQPVLHCLFSFLQLHFVFMNVKEIVHYLGWFRHAALMHLIATNVAIWIRLVLWESSKDWLEAMHVKHNSSAVWPPKEFSFNLHTLESDLNSPDSSKHKPTHKIYFTTNCWWRNPEVENTEDLIELHTCLQNSTVGAIWGRAMPFLYPFVIQYCLVASGVIYIIWCNLHNSYTRGRLSAHSATCYESTESTNDMNCSSSSKGLFFGLLILVAGIISLILFFVLIEGNNFNAPFVVLLFHCGILGIAALAAAMGMLQVRKMSIQFSQKKRLSELLQRIGMLAVYVYGICNIIAGGINIDTSEHLVLFLDGMLMVFQACFQSVLIHQISRKRLSTSGKNEKPGKEVVIFLVFSNIVLWLLESFTTQHQASSLLQKQFYGEIAWSVISRLFLPLVIFYRFHSAVALMEAWHHSYKM